ncbi:MAG: hypothetical protein HYT82_02730, partial [Candidatus Harrisonbacteria bacterium]|nr:hypothetical protein [Candidatus Harrisonbacteria bacterium]
GLIETQGNLTVVGTANVTGVTTLVYASTTGVSLNRTSALMLGGTATVTSLTGLIETQGTASSTSLIVGGGSTITGMVTGFCNIPNTTIQSSTTLGVLCSSATGILTSHRVFVSATGSLPVNFAITQASSSAVDTIGLLVRNLNTGSEATTSASTGNVSFNFFGVK